MAKAFDQNVLRMAQSLDIAQLAVGLHLLEMLHIDLAPGCGAADLVADVKKMRPDEWSEDLHIFWAELNTVQEELRADAQNGAKLICVQLSEGICIDVY